MWKETAEQLGTHATNVALWAKNRTNPDLRFWPAIIRFLGYDPRPEAQSVGQALKRHREGHGLTQNQLAAILNVDPSTLAKWEREERVPIGEYRQRVDAVLGPQDL